MSRTISLSLYDRLALTPENDRRAFLEQCDPDVLHAIVHREWRVRARPEQKLPTGDWFMWLLEGGRGSGKTDAASQAVVEAIDDLTPHVDHGRVRTGLIAPTLDDVRRTMIEGQTGLLSALPIEALYGQSVDRAWNRSMVELTLHSGATFKGFSSEKPGRLRGPQHHICWVDEAAALKDAPVGTADDTTWSNMLFGLRLPPEPRLIVTTTPKNNALVKALHRDVAQATWAALLRLVTAQPVAGPRVRYARMSTFDNLHNLAPAFREQVVDRYIGTRLGQQELEARLVDDVEGALWKREEIDAHRVFTRPDLARVITAVDPQAENKPTSAETGIVTVGIAWHDDGKPHLYVLADDTIQASPERWGGQAIASYRNMDAQYLIGEVNNGGDMIRAVIHSIDPTVAYDTVRATKGKAIRAEPVVSLYQQGRIHHVGYFADLEEQMTTWEPDLKGSLSPDRIDALVWACTYLMPDITERPASIGSPAHLTGALAQMPGYSGWRPDAR